MIFLFFMYKCLSKNLIDQGDAFIGLGVAAACEIIGELSIIGVIAFHLLGIK